MKIGEIAQQARVSKSLIRYYENKGVLPHASRDSAGYRDYGEADLARIRIVTTARRLGCSFEEIREMVAVHDDDCRPSPEQIELLSAKLADADSEMKRLRDVQSALYRLRDRAALRLADHDPENASPALILEGLATASNESMECNSVPAPASASGRQIHTPESADTFEGQQEPQSLKERVEACG